MASVTFGHRGHTSGQWRTNREQTPETKLTTPSPPYIRQTEPWYRESGRTRFAKKTTRASPVFTATDRSRNPRHLRFRWQTAQSGSSSKKGSPDRAVNPNGDYLSRRSSSTSDDREPQPPRSIRTGFQIRFCQAHWAPSSRGLFSRCPVHVWSCLISGGRAKQFLIGSRYLPSRARVQMAGKLGECLQTSNTQLWALLVGFVH